MYKATILFKDGHEYTLHGVDSICIDGKEEYFRSSIEESLNTAWLPQASVFSIYSTDGKIMAVFNPAEIRMVGFTLNG